MTRDECIAAAGEALARGLADRDAMTPRQAAQAAHQRGGPSVDELEARITAERASRMAAAS